MVAGNAKGSGVVKAGGRRGMPVGKGLAGATGRGQKESRSSSLENPPRAGKRSRTQSSRLVTLTRL